MNPEYKIETYQELTLDLNADVAEWCPTPNYTDILAAGTYQLNEQTQTREGILYLYSLRRNSSHQREQLQQHGTVVTSSLYSLHVSATLPLPGIFDLSWQPWNNTLQSKDPLLTAALADGSIRLFRLTRNAHLTAMDPDNGGHSASSFDISIQELARSRPLQDIEMALYIDQTLSAHDSIVSSYSSGNIRYHKVCCCWCM